MTFITTDDLQTFQNKYVDEEQTELLQTYCNAGMEKVKNFLGYNPEKTECTIEKYGTGGTLFSLDVKPIVSIESVTVDDVETDVSLFRVKSDNYIIYKDGNAFDAEKFYNIKYVAGFEEVPGAIKLCALQLASLYWESAGGNLAVSSTSFADTGSRVFNNFTADRFLKEIENYRILKF